MRLNKYIAHSGMTSRRKADELVFNGNVKVKDDMLVVNNKKISFFNLFFCDINYMF